MGIDATRKWASEGYTRTWPTRIRTTKQAGERAAGILEKIRRKS
jgi:3-polyprenyl-4-hydroxybenzoate decarboxylase